MDIFIPLVAIVILFVWLRNSLSSDMQRLSNEIWNLSQSVKFLERQLKGEEPIEAKPEAKKPGESFAPTAAIPLEPEPVVPPFVKEEIIEEYQLPKAIAIELTNENFEKKAEPTLEIKQPPTYSNIPTSDPQPTFFERYPDLEKFIGENLINKIGIGILVLGIGFFVKYAIDQNWIHEIGRVCIGILCSGILIFIAHRLRNTFKAFSSVLIGGGISVLYFTIAIAFHEYKLFNQATAFGIMVVITSFAVALSIAYNRIELAVLALIGGFSSPFIVSTGEGNYKILFTYLLILNSGMLTLAYARKWNLVNILSYIFTILIYGSWLSTRCLSIEHAPYLGAFIFATAFYIVFFLMNVVYNIRNKISFEAIEIGMLLSNTFLYYGAGMSILHYYHPEFEGLFTAVMGVFNFGFAFFFYKRQNVDRNLIFLLIGLVLTFISLAAPVQLEGNHITLFWSAEALLLLWFSQKSGIKLIRGTSLAINVLMLISLIMDWSQLYGSATNINMIPFLNKAFITSAVSILSVFMTIRLLKNETETGFIADFTVTAYSTILKTVLVSLLYLTPLFEINYQLQHYGYDDSSRYIVLGIYNFSFLSLCYLFSKRNLTATLSLLFAIASGFCVFVYVFLYNNSIIEVRNAYLTEEIDGLFFILHFILAVLFVSIIYIFNESVKRTLGNSPEADWIKWLTVFLTVYLCSAELNHIVSWMSYSPGRMIPEINKQVFKAGYSVLWGIISFILMQQGMRRKDRTLRIISLSLFFITILKLFLWDITGISEGGKIIAFISLGVLLLVVSFMYQRLKKLILEAEPISDATVPPSDVN